MQVAFVSRCITFYKYLSQALSAKYPVLNFVHFETPDDISRFNLELFSHIIFKISDINQDMYFLKKSRIQHPGIITIGLVIDNDFVFDKKIHGRFDFIFVDREIDSKLNEYFFNLTNQGKQISSEPLAIEKQARSYIRLNFVLSNCMFLISEGKTAREISIEINKSERTVEKYILKLRKIFDAESKAELGEIYKRISQSASN